MDSIDKSFLAHLFIECYLNTDCGTINESYSELPAHVLFEEYGVFKGCIELANKITSKILKIKGNSDISVELNNAWIKRMNIVPYFDSESSLAGQYMPGNSKIIKKNGACIFDPLTISVNTFYPHETVFICMSHELTHAYEDIKRFENESESLYDKANKLGYFKSGSKLSLVDKNEEAIKETLYYIASFEQNAFLATLASECEQVGETFRKPSEAFAFIRETEIFKNFKTVINNLNYLSKNANIDDLSSFLVFSNYKFKTVDGLKSFCRNKARKIEKKFNNMVPKIVYRYLMVKTVFRPYLKNKRIKGIDSQNHG